MTSSDGHLAGGGAQRTLPARENDLLAEICRAIVRGGGPAEIVQDCAERLRRYFGTASVGIWFRRDDRIVLEGLCLPDEDEDPASGMVRGRWGEVSTDADLPVPRAMRSRSTLRWAAGDPELQLSVREVLTTIDAAWLVAIPIFVDAEPVGGAAIALPEGEGLPTTDELLLEQALGVVGVVYTRGILQEAELKHRERALERYHLAAVGELAAGVAHEVNNPLNSVLHLATVILADAPDEPIRSWAASLLREARRAGRAMDTLRLFARPGLGEPTAVDAGAALDDAVAIMETQLERKGIEVVKETEDDMPPVLADPDRLRHVLHNVLANARQAMEADDGGRIRMELRRCGTMVEIGIEDTGPGMTPAVRDAIFRPFFTTRERTTGASTGMGLALAWRMVSEWDGEIIPGNWGHPRVEEGTVGEGGARITIRLPSAPAGSTPSAAPAGKRPEPVAMPPSGLLVLVVEDEEAVGAALATYLRRTGSEVEVVASAEEALEHLSDGRDYDVVITDLRMPGMGGEGFIRTVRDDFPDLLDRMVVTSGDVVSPGTVRRMEELGLPFLAKPYALEELAAVLHRVVGDD